MPTEARVLSGPAPLVTDHTASGADISAGEVVVVGSMCGLAMSEIEDGETGSLLIGNQTVRAETASIKTGDTFTDKQQVYWHDTNNEFTETSTGAVACGLADGAGDDTGLDILWNMIKPT